MNRHSVVFLALVTQVVKRPTGVETHSVVNYNRAVSKGLVVVMCALVAISASGCPKKNPAKDETGAVNAADRAGSAAAPAGPVDETPLQGIDASKLATDKQKLFYKLVGSLSSPCGKAHSLRTSFSTDTECKRAPFAVRYVLALLEDEGTEAQVREEYEHKYASTAAPVKLDVSKAPKVGADDAPVRLVEFFDYECPHCQAFNPMLQALEKAEQGKVVVYYMMFPLEKHTDSKSAAQAAVAAEQQGKFFEMHDLLFKNSPTHSREAVIGYAKELGMDAAQFEAAYNAAGAQVASDLAQGDAAGVDATPTLFFNDRKYEGPMHPKYIAMWIDEELAVNR
jgi:protein-disulfide isomerase